MLSSVYIVLTFTITTCPQFRFIKVKIRGNKSGKNLPWYCTLLCLTSPLPQIFTIQPLSSFSFYPYGRLDWAVLGNWDSSIDLNAIQLAMQTVPQQFLTQYFKFIIISFLYVNTAHMVPPLTKIFMQLFDTTQLRPSHPTFIRLYTLFIGSYNFCCSQSLATTVVQIFVTSPPEHNDWTKLDAGVLCLVKDHLKRSYYFRVYCPERRCLVWEHEVYNSMQYNAPRHFLHTFEAQVKSTVLT